MKKFDKMIQALVMSDKKIEQSETTSGACGRLA